MEVASHQQETIHFSMEGRNENHELVTGSLRT
jgi:hypothetical protein